MKSRVVAVWALLIAGAAACDSPIGPVGSTSVSSSGPVSPANGAHIAPAAQPVTLTVRNAFVGDLSAVVIYTFQLASDPAFAAIVQTRDAPQGSSQTSVALDVLPGGHDYYWRVRTRSNDTQSEFTNTQKFTIGPQP